ncbi:MAG TPA: cation-translocating P-type ATPase [Patescibacteria group bacterium]|nr:cation-translocating P-type ATPase [Patescibacteria group bacterium]
MSHLWHTLSIEQVISELNTNSGTGLSTAEVSRRLTQYGKNELQSAPPVSPWKLLLGQFKNVLVIILLLASVLSGVLGHITEAIAIAVIVLFAVILGFIQEYRAERAIEALRQMAAPTALVLRDGKEMEVPAMELVPGDVIIITTGDRIPADARLLEVVNLKIEEAALTGESVAVEKKTDTFTAPDLPLGDRKNIVYAGTSATYGRGRAIIVGTGMQTEFGKIAGMLQDVETAETPLQKNLDKVGKSLAKAAFVIIVLIVALGLWRGQPLLDMFIFGVALAVAVVPEALPAVVTISLAIGVQRMVKRHALVRRLPAVETLGSTTVICSDKTGTLTKDEMTVRKIYADGRGLLDVTGSGYEPKGEFLLNGNPIAAQGVLMEFLRGGVLCSDARSIQVEGQWDIKGDPTEGALIVVAAKAGINKEFLDEQNKRIAEIPFSSETKRMTTLHQSERGVVAYSKGAAEVILNSCSHFLTDATGPVPLEPEMRQKLLKTTQDMAEQALRVLAVAYKPGATLESAEKDMVFLGMVGMIDPPRAEAKAAIQTCKDAGIKIMMITGDHPLTATAIARELNLLVGQPIIITGPELEAMSDEELDQKIEEADVFARVSPAHKLRVVAALQKHKHIVAMTGDGVNDAPALKKADIGIAMGITGTDVTKEAASMTLTDDNFASIVAAVEEGRIIFGNIKKYLMYLLSSNIGEIGLMIGSTLLGLPLPLTAVQILYVNLATDGLPALALAVDPPDTDVMQHPPRRHGDGIFSRSVIALMLVGGLWSTIVNLSLFMWARSTHRTLAETMTMVFVSLVLIQFFKAYNFRSDRQSVAKKPFANKWLNRAILWELVLLALIIYVPFLQKPFTTFGLPWQDWALIIIAAFTVVPVLELTKWILRKRT